MPYGFRLRSGKLWAGDAEVGAAYSSSKNAGLARSRMTDVWDGYERIFKGSKIVRLLPLAEDHRVTCKKVGYK